MVEHVLLCTHTDTMAAACIALHTHRHDGRSMYCFAHTQTRWPQHVLLCTHTQIRWSSMYCLAHIHRHNGRSMYCLAHIHRHDGRSMYCFAHTQTQWPQHVLLYTDSRTNKQLLHKIENNKTGNNNHQQPSLSGFTLY